jgi:sigma-B regulation protein RsbU (phosphoserine phosphatase)
VTKQLDFPVVLARVNTQFQLKRATDDLRAAHARMKRDLEAAARIQQTLLPRQLPETDRIRSAWAYRPCDELAGDSLNIFPMGDRHIGLYVLDVSGHGVPAALLSVAVTRSLSRQGNESALLGDSDPAPQDISPAQIAAKLNALYPMESNGQHFFTMVYGILDTVSWEFRFVCAGHSPPVLIRPDGQQQRLDATAMPIGVTDEVVYEDTRVQLQSGDRLYLYSDGLTEELNSAEEEFGEERLLAAIAESQAMSLAESVDAMVQRAVSWRGDEHLKDDVSVLSIEIV